MTDATTAAVIAFTIIALIAYDIWVVWEKGEAGTISWTLLWWWLLHPAVMLSVFVVIGHLFVPQCVTSDPKAHSLDPFLGTLLGIVAGAIVFFEMVLVWPYDKAPAQPYPRAHLGRLLALMGLGISIGHLVFPQYILCGG